MSLTAGLDPQDTPTLAFPSEPTRLGPPPRVAVWGAFLVIVFLGLVGLYRGVASSQPQNAAAPRFSLLAGLSQPAIEAAAPAVVVPHSDTWSTLSGPRMVQPSDKPVVVAKAAVKSDDDDEDDSASPAAVDAATADVDAKDAPTDAAATPPAAATAPSAPPAATDATP
jgi:hypothetical protein